MELYQREFCDFLRERGAFKICTDAEVKDGGFALKSGRVSPFYIDMGNLTDGYDLKRLGQAYAQAINEHFEGEFDTIYGLSYRGVTVAVTTALKYWEIYCRDVNYCSIFRRRIDGVYNRRVVLGHQPEDGERIVLMGNLLTANSVETIGHAIKLLGEQAKVKIVGLIVAVDLMDHGHTVERTILQETASTYGVKTCAIVSMADLMEHLHEERELPVVAKEAIAEYYNKYSPVGTTEDWRW